MLICITLMAINYRRKKTFSGDIAYSMGKTRFCGGMTEKFRYATGQRRHRLYAAVVKQEARSGKKATTPPAWAVTVLRTVALTHKG